MGIRHIPSSAVVIGLGALFFLLYLLPWQSLPSSTVPVPVSLYSQNESFYSLEGLEHYLRDNDVDHLVPQSQSSASGLVTYRAIIDEGISFNLSGADVLVVLHIQKTGGTSFEKHIVQDLVIDKPCVCWKKRKRCKCPRPRNMGTNAVGTGDSWLFSRFSTGWVCGLHADWTELTSCVDVELDRAYGTAQKRRYFYAAMMRDPVHRFLSEFRHVQRGATWKASRHICNGRYATPEELGKCYSGRSWAGVTLKDFLSCPYNLAFNRQTRMLANLSEIGCYNKTSIDRDKRDQIMLASAKDNLASIAFVGLTEFQKLSQYVFEETFKLRFKIPFSQSEDTYSKSTLEKTSPTELEAIRQVNALDLELYSFAVQLLHKRFNELKTMDPNFDEHYNSLGQSGYKFSWNDIENED